MPEGATGNRLLVMAEALSGVNIDHGENWVEFERDDVLFYADVKDGAERIRVRAMCSKTSWTPSRHG